MKTGIYTITSPSGGMYVGSAVSFRLRWWIHRKLLRLGTHHCRALQRAFNKYGEENMVFTRIIICMKADLIAYEQAAMDALKPSYNTLKFAGSCLGSEHSLETRMKIRAAKLGKPRPPHVIEALRKSATGRKDTPETTAKRSASLTGIKRSPETRAKIAKARTGTQRSAETIEKLRLASTGRKAKPEVAYMLRTMHIGLPKSDETKKKMSESASAYCRENAELVAARTRAVHVGRKTTVEMRERMSAGRKAANLRRRLETEALIRMAAD